MSVSIQSIDINNGDSVLYRLAPSLRLRPGLNTLIFNVVAPYYNNAAKVQYRYRMGGSTGRWIDIGVSNQIRLPDLPPGDYALEVAATTTGHRWYAAAAPFLFTIEPPSWQTWWFRTALLAILAGLISWLVRFRENRLKRRQQEQLELAQLKNTALQYQLETEQVVNYFNRSISLKSTVDEALWDVAQQCIARLGFEDCVI